MAICSSCGAETEQKYCEVCGAIVKEGRAPTGTDSGPPPSPAQRRARRAPGPAPGRHPAPRTGQAAASGRMVRYTTYSLLALILYGAGVMTGIWLKGSDSGSLTSTAVDATQDAALANLPATAQAGKYMDEGVDFLQKGERTAAATAFRRAITLFEQALREDPNDLYAHTYLGLTQYYAGDSARGLETQRAVLKKDPNYLWALFNLAWMLETTGNKLEAAATYQKYLDVAPAEQANPMKYLEQRELIDRQIEAAGKAIERLTGTGGTAK